MRRTTKSRYRSRYHIRRSFPGQARALGFRRPYLMEEHGDVAGKLFRNPAAYVAEDEGEDTLNGAGEEVI